MMPRRRKLPVLFVTLCLSPLSAAEPSPSRQTPLVRAIQRVRPAVVNIHSQKSVASHHPYSPAQASEQKMNGMGTGVIVDERGYIITNHHVIEEVSSISITLVDGSTHTADVLGRDPETDLALLKIETARPLVVMPMGSSDDLLHGEPVIAIGNAFGYEHTITQGIISQLHRDVRLSAEQSYRDLIQTDASINPGNSGGPLINADGDMIGLNVAIRAGAQGIGFAIPVNEVSRVVTKLMSVRNLRNIWHGMACEMADELDPSPASGRVIVGKVENGSPAADAGFQPGDRLVAVDGRPITFAYDLERALLDKEPRQPVPVIMVRAGREQRMNLVVQPAPGASREVSEGVYKKLGARFSEAPLGLDVSTVSPQLRGGITVIEVARKGAASRAGLLPGDILVGLQSWETLSIDNVAYVLSRSSSATPLRFFAIRAGQIHRGWINLSPTD